MATNTGMFPDTIITNAGKKMIVQSQNGSTLTITRVALGDGVLGNNEDQQELTAIKREKLSSDISQFEDLGNGQFTLTFTIDNSTIEKVSGIVRLASWPKSMTRMSSSMLTPTQAQRRPSFTTRARQSRLVL